MTQQHTPGPWIVTHKGTRIAALHLPQGKNTICRVSDNNKKADILAANARVIAAAPDLLTETQENDKLLLALLTLDMPDIVRQSIKNQREKNLATIAKAAGKS